MAVSSTIPGAPRAAPALAHDDEASSRKRFTLACGAGGLAATVWFSWMITKGTFDFFQSQLYSNLYDAQARALFHGHWWMPANVLTIEGIRTGSHSYMYYGPVPSLLRMPVLLVTSRLDGRLTDPSMLLAFVVALVTVTRISLKARNLVRRGASISWAEASLAGAAIAVIGAGSAFFYLASRPTIYHEAELWGAALALASFDALLSFLQRPTGAWLAAAGALGTASLLTRGSVGSGPIAATGLLCLASIAIWLLRAADRRRRPGLHSRRPSRPAPGTRLVGILGIDRSCVATRWLPGLLAATVVPVVLYAWINEVKFHTLFSLPLQRQAFTAMSASRRAALAANGGSLFGAKFLPTALFEYLRPDNLSIHRLFPFIGFPGPATVIGSVRYDTLDWSSGASATMPVLVATGVVGLVAVFAARVLPHRVQTRLGSGGWPGLDIALLRIPLVAAAVGTLGALDIAYIANRYLSDFMPFIVMASLAGLWSLVALASAVKLWARVTGGVVLALLGLFGIWVNFALGIVYQRSLSPDVQLATRAGFVSFQENLDQALFGNPPTGVDRGAVLPRPGPVGELFVLGSCQGLYQSDGREWNAVERNRGAGLVRMRVTFPSPPKGARQPLLVTGTSGQGDILAVHFLGHDTVSMSYLFESPGKPWVEGSPITVLPGRAYTLDAVLDSHVHEISVTLDGRTIFDDSYFVRPFTKLYVGQSPFPAPVDPRFEGRLEQLPVSTPICDSLVKRMEAKP